MTYKCCKCKTELGKDKKCGTTVIEKPMIVHQEKVHCRSCYPGSVTPAKDNR